MASWMEMEKRAKRAAPQISILVNDPDVAQVGDLQPEQVDPP